MKDIYMLRTCDADGGSRNGFVYPLKVGATVEAPDWNAKEGIECGQGLHGLRNGVGDVGTIPRTDGDVWWQVWKVEPEDSRPTIGGKARWRTGVLVYSAQQEDGNTEAREGAINFLVDAGCPREGIAWDQVTTGDRGQSTSGDSGQSTSGYGGQSTSGYGGQSTSGYRGQSTSGDRGQSTSGDSGQSTSGDSGQVAAGKYGGLLCTWFDETLGGYRVKAGETGCGDGSDGLLKAGMYYRVSSVGQWEEVGPVKVSQDLEIKE